MPIVDISGLCPGEKDAKKRIRLRIKKYYAQEFDLPESATTVTFIADDSDDDDRLERHVIARLYSKFFMGMAGERLRRITGKTAKIMEQEARHVFNEAFPVPILAMEGGANPYQPPD